MSSPRTAIPLKDYGHTALQNEMHSSNVDPSVTSSPSATPPQNSLGRLVSSDLTRYMALFEECVRARKNRRAYNFLPSEEQERVSMSFNDFWKLDQILGGTETDFRWPSISFNSRQSIGIITWMPSPVHEGLAGVFSERLGAATQSLSPTIARRMRSVGSLRVGGLDGAYKASKKEADVLFRYQQQPKVASYTAAVEIGFSETYDELVDDVKLWIEGLPAIKTVILIKVEEDPSYRSPTRGLQDEEFQNLGFPQASDVDFAMVVPRDQAEKFGPLGICGLTWVGKISAFLEIWKKDPTTGSAKRQGTRTYFVGGDDGPAELDIRLHDLYPIDSADGGDTRLPITWETLKEVLEDVHYDIAVQRCCAMLMDRAKREDNIDDPGYVA